MDRLPISVCVVAHNEEENIEDCLASVDWVEEIIVVDDYSTDRTVEICRKYTDKVISHPWQGHVEQKNFCLRQAAQDWVLSVDADERISDELRGEIQREFRGGGLADGYFLPRRTHYLGRWIRHGGWYPNYQLRLFQRSKGRWGGDNPHDRVILDGRAKHFRSDLLHYTYKDIAAHIQAVNSFTNISARVKDERNVRFVLLHMLCNPIFKFFRMYFLKRGFLDGVAGFIVAAVGSFYVFLKYAKLWEIKRGRS